MNRELEAMRQETTGLALLHVAQTNDLYTLFVQVRQENNNMKTNVAKCLAIAEQWAKEHNDEFGALFIAELELVRWNVVLRKL